MLLHSRKSRAVLAWMSGLLLLPGARARAEFPASAWMLPGTSAHVLVITLNANGDPYRDALVASRFASLKVFHGSPNGPVAAGVLATASAVAAMAAGDIDSDGREDVLFVAGGELWLARAQAPAGFATPVLLLGGLSVQAVAVVDVDLDLRPDVVCASAFPGAVHVLRRLPQGGFAPALTTPLGVAPQALALADLDQDLEPDLVLADPAGGGVLACKGDGAGGFLLAQTFQTPFSSPTRVSLAHLDGDAIPDVVASSAHTPYASIARGVGDCTFLAPVPHFLGGGAFAGDWTGDGLDDVISAENGVWILESLGNGSFAPGTRLPAASSTRGAALGDVDGDGEQDLVLAVASKVDPGGGGDPYFKLGWLRSDGVGGYAGFTQLPLLSSAGVGWRESRDLNRDGIPDALGARNQPPHIVVRFGDGTGGFLSEQTLSSGFEVGEIVVGDVDGDGWPDLVEAHIFSNAVFVHRGGPGGFLAPSATPSAIVPGRLAVGDLDGDGRGDVLVCDTTTDVVHVFFATPQGTLAPTPVVTDLDVGWTNYLLEVLDVDLDGLGDVVVADRLVGVATWLGNGSGQFVQSQFLATSPFATSGALGDLDLDGIPDLVLGLLDGGICYCLQDNALVYTGDGAGHFLPGGRYLLGRDAFAHKLAHVDSDTHLDLVATLTSGEVAVLKGNGLGGFLRPTHYATAGRLLGVGDTDSDGKVDFITDAYFLGQSQGAPLVIQHQH